MQLQQKLESGQFVTIAEMEPPKGADPSVMLENARRVKGAVDAFLVPEMSNAVMRMSSLGGAMILQQSGMETVIEMNCRDRNRLALQADLLAANGLGIANVVAVAGADPSFGDHHQARSVYDINLLELLQAIAKLQAGRDMAGVELQGAPHFFVGATNNAGAKGHSPDLELKDLQEKNGAGALFFITPPIFDPPALAPFLKRIDPQQVKIIPTVLLLKSLGMARYIERNIDNIHLPPALISRIQKAPEKVRECIRIAAELIAALKAEGCHGVLIATRGWEKRLPEIINRI